MITMVIFVMFYFACSVLLYVLFDFVSKFMAKRDHRIALADMKKLTPSEERAMRGLFE